MKLRFIHHQKAKLIRFSLMHGLLGKDNNLVKIQLFENLESEGAKKSKY